MKKLRVGDAVPVFPGSHYIGIYMGDTGYMQRKQRWERIMAAVKTPFYRSMPEAITSVDLDTLERIFAIKEDDDVKKN